MGIAGIDKVPVTLPDIDGTLRCCCEIPTHCSLSFLPCHLDFDLVHSRLHLSFPSTHHAAPATMTAREETVLPPIDPSITDENDWWEFDLTDVKVLRPGKMLYANVLDASEDNPVQVIGCLELKKHQEHLGASSITRDAYRTRLSSLLLLTYRILSSSRSGLPFEAHYHRRCHTLCLWSDGGSQCRDLGCWQGRLVPHLACQRLSADVQSHGPSS